MKTDALVGLGVVRRTLGGYVGMGDHRYLEGVQVKLYVKERGKPIYVLRSKPHTVGFSSDYDPMSHVWEYETPDGDEPEYESVYDYR